MSSPLIKSLAILCAFAIGGYMCLLIATITFASVRTDLSSEIRELETKVGALETEYYEAIAIINSMDVASVGLVTPSRVEYVVEGGAPTFTRAGYTGQ